MEAIAELMRRALMDLMDLCEKIMHAWMSLIVVVVGDGKLAFLTPDMNVLC